MARWPALSLSAAIAGAPPEAIKTTIQNKAKNEVRASAKPWRACKLLELLECHIDMRPNPWLGERPVHLNAIGC